MQFLENIFCEIRAIIYLLTWAETTDRIIELPKLCLNIH